MKKDLFRIADNEALTTCRIKYYYDNNGNPYPVQKMVCDRKIFRSSSFELDNDVLFFGVSDCKEETPKIIELDCGVSESSLRRARKMIYDIIRCNHFTHFCTLTFDGSKIDRASYADVVRKFSQWCDNRVRRQGLYYVAVIERHKQSNGLHFHLLGNDSFKLVDSGTVKVPERKKPIKISTAKKLKIPPETWKTVYNISDWGYGFSTAIEITDDDRMIKVAGYLRKYLTKDFEKIGGRLYFSGGALRRPMYKYVDDDYGECEFDYEFSVGGNAYKVLNLE